tara:strand:+ start:509 stop:700 length:192 start_codon:yes stop_codon:yes gene_type:complete
MKVKGRVRKLNNFNATNIPCSSVEFSQLREGKEINLKDEVANKMLAMGIIKKINNKKAKKGEK